MRLTERGLRSLSAGVFVTSPWRRRRRSPSPQLPASTVRGRLADVWAAILALDKIGWGSARLGMSASVPGRGCGFAVGARSAGCRGRLPTGLAKNPSMLVARRGLKLSCLSERITLGYCTRNGALNKGCKRKLTPVETKNHLAVQVAFRAGDYSFRSISSTARIWVLLVGTSSYAKPVFTASRIAYNLSFYFVIFVLPTIWFIQN
jgi:hypothetical protein